MATDSDIARQLTQLVRAKIGDADVHALTTLPGHAGQSYSFELESGPPTARMREKLVLRLAPEGVRIAGTADVARQARIMESFAGTPVAVPPVRWYDDDPQWFGRPYFVVGFLRGDKLALGERAFSADETRHLARATLETRYRSRRSCGAMPARISPITVRAVTAMTVRATPSSVETCILKRLTCACRTLSV